MWMRMLTDKNTHAHANAEDYLIANEDEDVNADC